jgi:cytochrome c oxidase subunit III
MSDSTHDSGSEAQDPSHARDPNLAHHFDTPMQQFESGKLGMWIFLATEVLLFGGLFCAYAVYRSLHPEIFAYAHQYLDKTLGAVNTVILICSSLTMACAVGCAQRNRQRGLIVLLVLTLLFACGFLGVKFIEYEHKWKHGLMWGKYYKAHDEEHASHATSTKAATKPGTPKPTTKAAVSDERSMIAPAARGPAGLARGEPDAEPVQDRPRNVQLFFGVYFLMTGLHGLHVIGGMIAIAWILIRATRGHFSSRYFTPVDLVGLYWHLVDLIWIYLFPLLYLIR